MNIESDLSAVRRPLLFIGADIRLKLKRCNIWPPVFCWINFW